MLTNWPFLFFASGFVMTVFDGFRVQTRLKLGRDRLYMASKYGGSLAGTSVGTAAHTTPPPPHPRPQVSNKESTAWDPCLRVVFDAVSGGVNVTLIGFKDEVEEYSNRQMLF